MKTIIAQPKEVIAKFVAVVNHAPEWTFENYSALGLLDDDGALVAGVLYNHYHPPSIMMHVGAVEGRMWLTREFLHAAFDYPFNQLKCKRVTALVPKKNRAARQFDEHLGFKLEGCMRQALADDDMLVYGMLRSECKYITGEFVDKLKRRRPHEEELAA